MNEKEAMSAVRMKACVLTMEWSIGNHVLTMEWSIGTHVLTMEWCTGVRVLTVLIYVTILLKIQLGYLKLLCSPNIVCLLLLFSFFLLKLYHLSVTACITSYQIKYTLIICHRAVQLIYSGMGKK